MQLQSYLFDLRKEFYGVYGGGFYFRRELAQEIINSLKGFSLGRPLDYSEIDEMESIVITDDYAVFAVQHTNHITILVRIQVVPRCNVTTKVVRWN